ncbi:hypothetical protein G7046_g6784 [Stylonectria norvegica]|nr:hypothetical protein G7046_g6784 [Stylonectria norvegica]
MESTTSGPVVFCAYLASAILYWPLFYGCEYLFRQYYPALYHRLRNEDKRRQLYPILIMVVRGFIGVFFTVPSCAYAAYTTPFGLDQPLNTAGKVCIVTQSMTWSSELANVVVYSHELFLHHLICLFVTMNLTLSPSIHQIKPLYIYFASQLGDLGPVSIMILKKAGHKPHNSRLLYWVALASGFWLAVGKVGTALVSIGGVFQSPYRVSDWMWAFSLLFFAIYSIEGSYSKLKWVGLLKYEDARPFTAVWKGRYHISLAHVSLAGAVGVSFISTIFVYCLFSSEAKTLGDIGSLWVHALVASLVGLGPAFAAKVMLPNKAALGSPVGKDLYLQMGIICAGAYMTWATNSLDVTERTTILGAVALNMPLFQAFTRLAHYCTASDFFTEQTMSEQTMAEIHTNNAVEKKTAESSEFFSHVTQDVSTARVSTQRSLTEGAVGELTEKKRSGSDSSASSNGRSQGETLVESGESESDAEFGLASKGLRSQAYPHIDPELANDHYRMVKVNACVFLMSILIVASGVVGLPEAATFAAASCFAVQMLCPGMILRAMQKRSKAAMEKAAAKATAADKVTASENSFQPGGFMLFSILAACILQVINSWEVYRNPDYSAVAAAPVGFENFRMALTCPGMWTGALVLGAVQLATLSGLTKL